MHVNRDNHFVTWHNSNFLILIRRFGLCCCFYMLLKSFTFTTIWKDFLVFTTICWLYMLYLTQHMLLFQMEYMQFANLVLFFSSFTKPMLRRLIVVVRNAIIRIADDRILVDWTDTMLGWNIQLVWSMNSSVIADRRVIYHNTTYDFFCYFLRLLICWILSTTLPLTISFLVSAVLDKAVLITQSLMKPRVL